MTAPATTNALQEGVHGFYHSLIDAERPDPLSDALMREGIVNDGKVLVDLNVTPAVVERYLDERQTATFDLGRFAAAQKILPPYEKVTEYRADPEHTLQEHITAMQPKLILPPSKNSGTRIGMRNPDIKPGERFDEGYSWDAYWSMMWTAAEASKAEAAGDPKKAQEQIVLMRDILENRAQLIEQFGYIPNGTRNYYLGRSQRPFFSKMVQLMARYDGPQTLIKYLPHLEKEYAFWMDGAQDVGPGDVHRRVVGLSSPDGKGVMVGNRHFDDAYRFDATKERIVCSPRPESREEDIAIALEALKRYRTDPRLTWLNLRGACERGEDFGENSFADGRSIATIDTTDKITVTQQAMLFDLERTIAHAYKLLGDEKNYQKHERQAANRATMTHYTCWNPQTRFFHDYNFREERQTDTLYAGAVAPMYVGMTTAEQDQQMGETIKRHFYRRVGGMITSIVPEGVDIPEQWTKKNIWPFNVEMAVSGCRRAGLAPLANAIKVAYMLMANGIFEATGQVPEKGKGTNDMHDFQHGGGGEYKRIANFAGSLGQAATFDQEAVNPVLGQRWRDVSTIR